MIKETASKTKRKAVIVYFDKELLAKLCAKDVEEGAARLFKR